MLARRHRCACISDSRYRWRCWVLCFYIFIIQSSAHGSKNCAAEPAQLLSNQSNTLRGRAAAVQIGSQFCAFAFAHCAATAAVAQRLQQNLHYAPAPPVRAGEAGLWPAVASKKRSNASGAFAARWKETKEAQSALSRRCAYKTKTAAAGALSRNAGACTQASCSAGERREPNVANQQQPQPPMHEYVQVQCSLWSPCLTRCGVSWC